MKTLTTMFFCFFLSLSAIAADSVLVSQTDGSTSGKIVKNGNIFSLLAWNTAGDTISGIVLTIPSGDIHDTDVSWNASLLCLVGYAKSWVGSMVIVSRKYKNPYMAESRKNDTLFFCSFSKSGETLKDVVTVLETSSVLQHVKNERIFQCGYFTAPAVFCITWVKYFNYPGGATYEGYTQFYSPGERNKTFSVYKTENGRIDSVFCPRAFDMMNGNFRVSIATDTGMAYYENNLYHPVGIVEKAKISPPMPITIKIVGGNINFLFTKSGMVNIRIFSLIGREIVSLAKNLPSGNNCLALPKLPAGNYICVVGQKGALAQKIKFILK